ncbi:MAG: dehydrogenase, partial [Candidatus Krumholzibacteria bacterium]|nr:dehydrogenase [Candidatus Krumholzibacteria bacterium]
MKQILQSLKTGKIELIDGPVPRVEPGWLLIRTRASVISTGTERMLLEFGKANLINKARQQPGKVRMVLDKIKTDGLLPTLDAVRSKLDEPLAMGYSNCGVVLETGDNSGGFSAGDRVVSNGHHAEVVSVPANLCAKIPDGVGDETAAFTVVGSIALEGIRLAQPTL